MEENDRILLNVPDNEEDLTFEGIDIYQQIKERKLREEEETAEQLNSPLMGMENNMKKTSNNQINRFG